MASTNIKISNVAKQAKTSISVQGQGPGPQLATPFSPRLGFGTIGLPIKVQANLYPLESKGSPKDIYHYDVVITAVEKISNQKYPSGLLKAVFLKLYSEQTTGPYARMFDALVFDGSQKAYTTVPFQNKTEQFEVSLPESDRPHSHEDGQKFKVTCKLVTKINTSKLFDYCGGDIAAKQVSEVSMTALTALKVLIRDEPSKRFEPIGSRGNRFFGMESRVPLSDGAVIGKGVFQSVRPTNSGYPAINLDTAYSAFVQEGPLPQVAARLLGLGGGGSGGRGGRGGRGGGRGEFGGSSGEALPPTLNSDQIDQLRQILRHARFTISHRNTKEFIISGFTPLGSNQMFFAKDNKKISVAKYFKTTYNINLSHPGWPCVTYKKNFVPMELVVISANHLLHPINLNSNQTAEMIKYTALEPPVRRSNIVKWRETLAYDRQPKIKAWGLEIPKTMMEIDARVLNGPRVNYGGKPLRPVVTAQGGWNLSGKIFYQKGADLSAWSVVCLDSYMQLPDLQKFIIFFIKIMNDVGINVTQRRPPMSLKFHARNPESISQGLKWGYSEASMNGSREPQMVVVILPKKDTILKEQVKSAAFWGMKMPVVTQCLVANKLTNPNERALQQYCANVAMKMNMKLAGITHIVALNELPGVTNKTIIFGADCTHPSPVRGGDKEDVPTIAAVVATTDGSNTKYRSEIRLQTGRQEIIQDMASIAEKMLREYAKANKNQQATKIIFYRDGIDEGSYEKAVLSEIKAIRDACKAIDLKYKPTITYCVAVKRHNIRLFGQQAQIDKTGNLPAGTVCDKGITHPFLNDFYLQSQTGLKGTARPTHYVILVDENKFTADAFQKLTNNLCYTFGRATRSVGLVTPCYYADILATAARPLVYHSQGRAPAKQGYKSMDIQNRIDQTVGFQKSAWFM